MDHRTNIYQVRTAGKPIPYTGPGMILDGGHANLAGFSRPGVAFANSGSYQAITEYPDGKLVIQYPSGTVTLKSQAISAALEAVRAASVRRDGDCKAYRAAAEALRAVIAKEAPPPAAATPEPAAQPTPAAAAASTPPTASPSPVAATAPAKPAPPPAKPVPPPTVSTPPEPSVPHPFGVYQERAALAAAARAPRVSDPLVSARTASPKSPASFAEIANRSYSERKSRVR